MKYLVPTLLLLSGAAQAQAHGEAAADCAALWQGVALEAADNPDEEDSAESASLLARQFSLSAAAAGLAGQPLRATILEALPGYRLLYRGVIAEDDDSREIFEQRAVDCNALLEAG
ncbi:hypothetical protein PVT71_11105 [Salipiger sp. H15]|uniref:Uncharacterized protein n=1 Tax=Alloyangia sp. H15 TaxID=3029062 RepID=A0AAU8ADR3_9RHOB